MSAPQTVYMNGEFIPRDQAKVDIEDRGFQFGDGVYEVLRIYDGKAHLVEEHQRRLRDSLSLIEIDPPAEADYLGAISEKLAAENDLPNARVYWQITRGAGPRNHIIQPGMKPTVIAMAKPEPKLDGDITIQSANAILMPDVRWHHCSIKSVMLLPNSLAKSAASRAGAIDAIMHRDGIVTECGSMSLFIVRDGKLMTHPADQFILGGITRKMLLKLARDNGIDVLEQTFTVDDLLSADEVFVSGTTTMVICIKQVDTQQIADGQPGPITQRMFRLLVDYIIEQTAG